MIMIIIPFSFLFTSLVLTLLLSFYGLLTVNVKLEDLLAVTEVLLPITVVEKAEYLIF